MNKYVGSCLLLFVQFFKIYGFFVYWGPFLLLFVKKGPSIFILWKWVMSLGGRTTLRVKSSSMVTVYILFF